MRKMIDSGALKDTYYDFIGNGCVRSLSVIESGRYKQLAQTSNFMRTIVPNVSRIQWQNPYAFIFIAPCGDHSIRRNRTFLTLPHQWKTKLLITSRDFPSSIWEIFCLSTVFFTCRAVKQHNPIVPADLLVYEQYYIWLFLRRKTDLPKQRKIWALHAQSI